MTGSSSQPVFNIGGLASGLDTNSIISELMSIEQQPQQRIQQQETIEQQRVSDLTSIQTQLQNLATAAAALSDPGTWMTAATITSSDPTNVTATGTAPPGGFTIGVSNLARAAQLTQSSSMTAASGPDTLHVVIGPSASPAYSFDVPVGSGDGLDTIAADINKAASGHVYASVVNSKLVITGQDTGAANTIAVTSTGGGTVASDLGLTQTVAPLSAHYTLDGTAMTSSTNTLTDVATGLTVNLLGVTSSDATISVGTAGPNTAAVQQAIQSFVSAYNATIDLVDEKVNEQKVAQPQSSADQLKGDLNADPSLLSLLSQLRQAVSSTVTGAASGMDNFVDAGLSTGAAVGSGTLNQDAIRGDLTLDTSTLTNALTSSFDDVKRLFTSVGSGDARGLAQRITGLASSYTGANGVITSEISGENSLIASLQQQSADWDVRLNEKETALRQQFTSMETSLSQLQSQGSWLSSQIASL